jgi:quinol---cytochrome c reductase iron-sulfur subunit, bacillus type
MTTGNTDTPDNQDSPANAESAPAQDETPEGEGLGVLSMGEARSEIPMSRRSFINKAALAMGGIGTAMLGGPLIGFLVAPLFRKPPEVWRTLGPVEQFKVGETVEVTFEDASPLPWAGVTANTAAWLRRNSDTEFIAFSVQCTHLGCPVSWLSGANLFMCPCHGGVYYPDGRVAAGPPPEPLLRYNVRVQGGQVQIDAGSIPKSPDLPGSSRAPGERGGNRPCKPRG